MKLHVERVTSPEKLGALAPEWAQLHASIRPRLPFATLHWLSRWWHHYRERRPLIRDEFYVHTLRDDARNLVAVAPLMLTERPGFGPFRSRRLAFFGSDRNVTELRGMLCAADHEATAVSSLLGHLVAQKRDWDWFIWSGVRSGGEAQAILSSTDGFAWHHELPDCLVELPGTWAEFRATRSRNIKESLRKCYNSLKRDGHEFEFRVAGSATELRAALCRFLKLHTQRAKAMNMLAHADVFSSPRARALLSDFAANPDQAPHLRVFELEVSGRVVASRLGFLLGDELYLYFSGFEPEWSRYSVMTTVTAEAIKWAIGQQCRFVNLSPGLDQSKTRWGSTTVSYATGVLVSPSERGRLTFGALSELDNQSRTGSPLGRLLTLARRNI